MKEIKASLASAYRDSVEKTDRWVVAISAGILGYISNSYSSENYSKAGEFIFELSTGLVLAGLILGFLKLLGNAKLYWKNYCFLESKDNKEGIIQQFRDGASSMIWMDLPINREEANYIISELGEGEKTHQKDYMKLHDRVEGYAKWRSFTILIGFIGLIISMIYLAS
ncbi:hypothetical protein [Kangiella koreensis]|uniref:Uncharacterized protein n=1 Tax=Kangiella koreensis (strain DSM 16069 / JCM 12317 / KCTC 12182 / SW-125) TaxID=523791 RepID=C7RBV0_KANKD|nr:hypothetical protein [Kangiella koreensis]ACV26742.1 hypothetical protein Kkor_1329 [Kangiella koreensis DSM 16069]